MQNAELQKARQPPEGIRQMIRELNRVNCKAKTKAEAIVAFTQELKRLAKR